MFKKRETIIISVLSALAAGILCAIAVFAFTSQPAKSVDLYGTYQFDIRNLDHGEYLAVMPALAADAGKNEGDFQWYNADEEMLSQGSCKVDEEGFAVFYADGDSIGTIFVENGKYYFVGKSLEPQEITKISEEPMVSSPF